MLKNLGARIQRGPNGVVSAVVSEYNDIVGVLGIVDFLQASDRATDDGLLVSRWDENRKAVNLICLFIGSFLAKEVQADDNQIQAVQADKGAQPQ